MKALDELIAQKLPRLSAHLNALEADVSILATDWFLTLYSASMPSETVSAAVCLLHACTLRTSATRYLCVATGRYSCPHIQQCGCAAVHMRLVIKVWIYSSAHACNRFGINRGCCVALLQVARVWDALFLEGSKILFRTALAVLKAQEDTLLAFDNAGALSAFAVDLTSKYQLIVVVAHNEQC